MGRGRAKADWEAGVESVGKFNLSSSPLKAPEARQTAPLPSYSSLLFSNSRQASETSRQNSARKRATGVGGA